MEAREAALGGFGDPGDEATGGGSRVHDRPPGGDISRKRCWGCRPSLGGAPSRAAVCARKGPPPLQDGGGWLQGFRARATEAESRPRAGAALRGVPPSQPPVTRGPEGVLATHVRCPHSGPEGRQNPLRVLRQGPTLSGLQGRFRRSLSRDRHQLPPQARPRPLRRLQPQPAASPQLLSPPRAVPLMLFLFIHLTTP